MSPKGRTDRSKRRKKRKLRFFLREQRAEAEKEEGLPFGKEKQIERVSKKKSKKGEKV